MDWNFLFASDGDSKKEAVELIQWMQDHPRIEDMTSDDVPTLEKLVKVAERSIRAVKAMVLSAEDSTDRLKDIIELVRKRPGKPISVDPSGTATLPATFNVDALNLKDLEK
jgi:hypothetical protein